jgi:hypothetical protein
MNQWFLNIIAEGFNRKLYIWELETPWQAKWVQH